MTDIERRQGHLGRLPTDEQVEQFLQMLRVGNYVRTAAAYCHISEGNVHHWMREGCQETGRQWTQDFYVRVQEARAFAQASHVQNIAKAATAGDWRASAFFLERSDPHHWGLRERHDIEFSVADKPKDVRAQLEEALALLGEDLNEVIEAEAHDEPESEGPADPDIAESPPGIDEPVARPTGRTGVGGRLVVRRTA